MLPLFSESLPASAADLTASLERSLRRLFDPQKEIVAVVDKAFPVLERLRINLDGAELRTDAPLPTRISGETIPVFEVMDFEVVAKPLFIEGVPVGLQLRADNVELHQARARDENIVLVLHAADAGYIAVSVAAADVEKLALVAARREAGKHGVSIEDLNMSLASPSPRAVEATAEVRARKAFFRGVIRVKGKVELDEKLSATLSELACAGDGTFGTMASALIRPQFERLNGRRVNFASVPLGEICLREINVAVGERLELTAQFTRRS